MAKLADYKLNKVKQRMEAANAKPERPRINEQLGLEKTLLDLQKQSSEPERQIDAKMYGDLSQKWKGNHGGSGGDAFIGGLTAGIQKGSFAEDKARNKKVMDFTEKMKNMVEEQNVQLFKEEKLDNARKSVTPRIMAYLDTYKSMSPNDRKVYLQNTLEEYNGYAGTNYKLVDSAGSEPWKIIVSDGDEIRPLDLMSFIKTPEEKKLDYYYNSAENQQYEKELAQEDSLQRQNMESQIRHHKDLSTDAEIKRKERQEALDIEKEILDANGDYVKFIDNMPTSEKIYAEKQIKEYTEKSNQALAAEKRLQRAVQIAKDHPALFGNLNAIIASRYNEDPGYLNNLLKNKIPKKDLNAMSELQGIVKNIFTDSIKGVPAKGINQFIEKKIEGGSPNQRWTAEAFSKVVNEALEENKPLHDEYKKGSDYGSSGLFYRPKAKSRKESTPEINDLEQEEQALLRERELLLNGK
jgi:hypothetical protein